MSTDGDVFDSGAPEIYAVETRAPGPAGRLPLTEDLLRHSPSGDLFGLSQNAGMGWEPAEAGRRQFLILSTQGGLRAPDGKPIALGYHTGHWEIGLLVQAAAEELRRLQVIPFAGACSDPCDGRTQGTPGMFDSLPYRNDAAIVLRRLARSLPLGQGVLGIATCDKGLPAMMMAVAGLPALPGVIVPGGVTLPPAAGEDAGDVQTLGARFAQGRVSLEEAAELGCRACASPGGGCQFLGTAATSQVVAEALGLSLPHSALAPSGQPVWLDMARRSARALVALAEAKRTVRDILTPASLRNAMALHAAFGGSTNLLLHVPAIAHAAGLAAPDGGGLDRGESPRAAAGQRPAERSRAPPHGAGLPGRRRAGGDAAPAAPGPARHGACSPSPASRSARTWTGGSSPSGDAASASSCGSGTASMPTRSSSPRRRPARAA